MLTHTCMAIYNLYQKFHLSMKELHNTFTKLFHTGGIAQYAKDPNLKDSAHDELDGFLKHMLSLTDSPFH